MASVTFTGFPPAGTAILAGGMSCRHKILLLTDAGSSRKAISAAIRPPVADSSSGG
jgi:hypothetical protein